MLPGDPSHSGGRGGGSRAEDGIIYMYTHIVTPRKIEQYNRNFGIDLVFTIVSMFPAFLSWRLINTL